MIRQYVKPIHYLHFMKFAETPSKIIFQDDISTFIAQIDVFGHSLVKLDTTMYSSLRGEKDDANSRHNARIRSESQEAIVRFTFTGKIFVRNICARIETNQAIYNVVVFPNYENDCIKYMGELYKQIVSPPPPPLLDEIRVVSPPPPPLLGLEDQDDLSRFVDIADIFGDLFGDDSDERMDSPVDEE